MSGSLSSHARVAGTRTRSQSSQQDADVANRGRRLRPARHQLFRLRPRTIAGVSAGVRTNGSLMVTREPKRTHLRSNWTVIAMAGQSQARDQVNQIVESRELLTPYPGKGLCHLRGDETVDP